MADNGTAKRVDALKVDQSGKDEHGLWLEVRRELPLTWEQVKALPEVVEFKGTLYTRRGWNSDTGWVCYRQADGVARPVASA